ncbi:MAG: stage 0 sporulation protein [Ruminococcaceae bacterium]|nr:stage 0 sporulation protein [Oscillospiraceae bacterium]
MKDKEYNNVFDVSEIEDAIIEAKTTAETEETEVNDLPEEIEIVGVRFSEAGKIYYFAPEGIKCDKDTSVIVKTARGSEFGTVVIPNKVVKSSEIVLPLRSVERIATDADVERYERNMELEKEAFVICQKKIRDHGLEMKLIDAQYTFDNTKLLFNFSADKRIDFRELVKDLASVFRTRIELRQIGIRDEAKLMGGLGACGRPFCCATFLSDFAQVSIKMAKEQNLSLNSTKISGTCGRLMCCLRFEHEVYEEAIKSMPGVDARVKTPDGVGFVIETSPLVGLVKVKFVDKNETITIKAYDKNDVKVLPKDRNSDKNGEKKEEKRDSND